MSTIAMDQKRAVIEEFAERFGHEPKVVIRAPGRVNLIGEHTDYNDGFVFPIAIERAAWIALEPTGDRHVDVYSTVFGDRARFDLDRLEKAGKGWAEYIKGVAWALAGAGHRLAGWRGTVGGDVPLGSGLSSSAALELAAVCAFEAAGGYAIDAKQRALLAQKAENEWIGVRCGIMDQLISSAGEKGMALLIDCRSLELKKCPMPSGTAVVVLDTATRRQLHSSAYNERRAQCEQGAAFFGVGKLRDVSPAAFGARAHEMEETVRRRCRHVISENARTLAAAAALESGDAVAFGRLMDASHASLRDDFEVSSTALDEMVAVARSIDGCLGARMTGAGFGGCAVALVRSDAVERFLELAATGYRERTGHTPYVFASTASAGAGPVDPSA